MSSQCWGTGPALCLVAFCTWPCQGPLCSEALSFWSVSKKTKANTRVSTVATARGMAGVEPFAWWPHPCRSRGCAAGECPAPPGTPSGLPVTEQWGTLPTEAATELLPFLKSTCESPNPGPQNVTVLGRGSLQMELAKRSPPPQDWCPSEKGRLGTDVLPGRAPCVHGEIGDASAS